jgi:hypothetical protein
MKTYRLSVSGEVSVLLDPIETRWLAEQISVVASVQENISRSDARKCRQLVTMLLQALTRGRKLEDAE